MNRHFVGSRMKSRIKSPARYVVALAVLIVVSIIVSSVCSAPSLQADLTGQGLYTLSENTRSAIRELSSDVCIYTLYSPGNDNKTLTELLKKYASESERLTLTSVDPMGRRSELEQIEGYGDIAYGSVVVYCEQTGLSRAIAPADIYYEEGGMEYFAAENRLTSAIKYVSTGEEYSVYLLYEHREKNSEEFSGFLSGLRKNSIEVKSYDLLLGEQLDPERDVLISVSPRQDFSGEEIARLYEFMDGGGTFMLFLDSAEYDAASGTVITVSAEIPNLTGFLNDLGLGISSGLLYDGDPEKTGMRPSVIELDVEENSLAGSASGKKAVMGECVPIIIKDASRTTGLLYTSDTAYSASLLSAPYCVMAACPRGKGRLIFCSGSSLITMDGGLSNSELISGLISSAGIETSGGISAKPLKPVSMVIDHGIVKVLLAVLLIVVLPAALLAAGAEIIKKRKTGRD